MDKVRIAATGTGPKGRQHIEILAAFDDVDLVAVCDPATEARDSVADEFGIPGRHATVEELLDAEDIDAIIVAPPAHLNGIVALPCLERGVHTLLEKPPGLSVEETKKLRDAAAKSGAITMVGWNRRFDSMIAEARRMIEERGPIVQLVGEFHKSMTVWESSGRHPDHLLDKMLLETSIHSIDLMRALAGSEVAEVHAVSRRVFHKHRDVHAALVEFENGCVAQIVANYTTDARLERYEIHGKDISAYLEGIKEGYVVVDGERVELDNTGDGGSIAEDRLFIDCVKEGRPVPLPGANLDEAVKTMELCEAILAGIRE